MNTTTRWILVTTAAALMLQGCGFVAGAAVGGTAGYLLHEEGYQVRSPVTKNEPQGYNLRSPVVREPGH